MKHLSYLLTLLPGAALLTGCGNAAKKQADGQPSQKPNVIYLITDDLGIGDLSCYGATKISTPAENARRCGGVTKRNTSFRCKMR